MTMRLAQVVYTLTQLPTITSVSFELDNQPVEVFGAPQIALDRTVDRSTYEDLEPAIMVESPCLGDTVFSPLEVTGTADISGGEFQLEITDAAGRVIATQNVQVSSGTSAPAPFAVSLPFKLAKTEPGFLSAYSLSAQDGSRTNVVKIPLTLANS